MSQIRESLDREACERIDLVTYQSNHSPFGRPNIVKPKQVNFLVVRSILSFGRVIGLLLLQWIVSGYSHPQAISTCSGRFKNEGLLLNIS